MAFAPSPDEDGIDPVTNTALRRAQLRDEADAANAAAEWDAPLGEKRAFRQGQDIAIDRQVMAERVAEINRRRQEKQQRERSELETAAFNSAAKADFEGSGREYYTDPLTKRLTPVREAGTGRDLYKEQTLGIEKDPKTGRPVRVKRNRYGERIVERPASLTASSDNIYDDNLYTTIDGESVPYMTIQEAEKDPDVKVRNIAAGVLRKRKAHEESRFAQMANVRYDGAKMAIDQAQADLAEIEDKMRKIVDPATGVLPPEQQAMRDALNQQRTALTQALNNQRGPLQLGLKQAEHERNIARSRALVVAFDDELAQMEEALAEGRAKDPAVIQDRIVEMKRSREIAAERLQQLTAPRPAPSPVAAPAPAGPQSSWIGDMAKRAGRSLAQVPGQLVESVGQLGDIIGRGAGVMAALEDPNATPAQTQAAIEQSVTTPTPVAGIVSEVGREMAAQGRSLYEDPDFQPDPARNKEIFAQAADSVGSLAGAVVTPGGVIPKTIAGGLLNSNAQATEARQTLAEKGAPLSEQDQQALQQFVLNLPAGGLEAVPWAGLLKRFGGQNVASAIADKWGKNWLARVSRSLFGQAAMESGEEGLQQLWGNAAAIAGYDPARAVTEGVGTAMAVGGLMGGALGGGLAVAAEAAGRGQAPGAQPTDGQPPIPPTSATPSPSPTNPGGPTDGTSTTQAPDGALPADTVPAMDVDFGPAPQEPGATPPAGMVDINAGVDATRQAQLDRIAAVAEEAARMTPEQRAEAEARLLAEISGEGAGQVTPAQVGATATGNEAAAPSPEAISNEGQIQETPDAGAVVAPQAPEEAPQNARNLPAAGALAEGREEAVEKAAGPAGVQRGPVSGTPSISAEATPPLAEQPQAPAEPPLAPAPVAESAAPTPSPEPPAAVTDITPKEVVKEAPVEPRDQGSGDSNFSYTAWSEGDTQYATEEQVRRSGEIPARIDSYRPGHIKWGSNPERGRAIQRSRAAKQRSANWGYFKEAVLPKIKGWLNPMAWHDIAQSAPTAAEKAELYAQGDWVRHEFNGQEVWTHPTATPSKHALAQAITDRRPVSKDVNPKALPEGYVLEGDQYVFRGGEGSAPPAVKPPTPPPEAPAPTPNFATATAEEIDAWAEGLRNSDRQVEEQVFGKNAEKYRKLQRIANSSNRVASDPTLKAADAQIAEMEAALTPEQQDLLYGRALPEGYIDPQEARRLRALTADIDSAESGADLARASSRILQGAMVARSKGTPIEGRQAEFLARVLRKAEQLNVGVKDLVRAAFAYRSGIEGDDVFELAGVTPQQLAEFLGESQPTTENAPEIQSPSAPALREAPENREGVRRENEVDQGAAGAEGAKEVVREDDVDWHTTTVGRRTIRGTAQTLAEEDAKEAFVTRTIQGAPSYEKLLAAYDRFRRDLNKYDYKPEYIRQRPWELLTAHGGVMDAKSGRAKTLRDLANAVFRETGLPRKKQDGFRGSDGLDWDRVTPPSEGPTPATPQPPPPTPAPQVTFAGIDHEKRNGKWYVVGSDEAVSAEVAKKLEGRGDGRAPDRDVIARMEPQSRSDIDNGTFYNEWRVRKITTSDLENESIRSRASIGDYLLERRHVRTKDGALETEGDWMPMGSGRTREAAMEDGWETQLSKATSLDSAHARVAAFIAEKSRRSTAAAKEMKEASEQLSMLPEAGQAEYERELKAARLHKLASQGKAPKDKIDAIKERLRAKYVDEKKRATERYEAAKKQSEAVNAFDLAAFDNESRTAEPPSPKPRASDRAIAALQKAKIGKPGRLLSADPFSVAYDAAIDIAVVAIRAGRTVADAAKLATQRLRAKFPQATDRQVAQLEAAIRTAAEGPPPAESGKMKPSKLPESLKAAGAPAETIEYFERAQDARRAEAAAIIKRDGPQKAEAAISDPALPEDTRMAIGGQLLNERMLAFQNAKGADADRITRDIRRITAKMQPEATRMGQGISMLGGVKKDIRIAAAYEYVREAQKAQKEALGGDPAQEAAQEVADAFNKTKDQAARDAAIERLKKRYSTKPVRRMLDALKTEETARKLKELGALTSDDLLNVAANALGIPGADAATLREISDLVDRIDNAKTPAEEAEARLELTKKIANENINKVDLEFSNIALNILFSGNTQYANASGNFMRLMSQLATTALVNPRQAGELIEGAKRGVTIGATEAKSIWQTGRSTRDFQDKTGGAGHPVERVDYAKLYPGMPKAIARALNVRARTMAQVGRFMRAADALAYYPAREAYARMTLAKLLEGEVTGDALKRRLDEALHTTPEAFESAKAQATAEGYSGISRDTRVYDIIEERRRETMEGAYAADEAEKFGAESTYTNEPEGLPGAIYRSAKHLVEGARIGGVPVLRPWMMFLRTPTNMVNASLNYLPPVGAIRAYTGKTMDAKGETRHLTEDERNRLYAQASIGTALMAGATAAIAKGLLDVTFKGPEDREKKEQLMAQGWRPYSFRIGDGPYIGYRDSPALIPLAVVGYVADAYKYNKDSANAFLGNRVADALLHAPLAATFSVSPLTALSDLMGAASGQGGAGTSIARTVTGLPAQAVIPGNRAIMELDRYLDPKMYDSNAVARTIPVARRMGEVRTDVQGRPITGLPSDRFYTEPSEDRVDRLLAKKSLFIPGVSRTVRIGDELATDEQITEYRRESGKRIRERLLAEFGVIATMNREEAQEYIDDITREERRYVLDDIRARVPVAR